MTSAEREYLDAHKAHVQASARLRAARAALPAGLTPTEVLRRHSTEWIEDMLQAYRDGERNSDVLAQRFGRSRYWINHVLKISLGHELRRGSRVKAP